MDVFNIVLPLKNEYLTTVRLTTGGVLAVAEFDVDTTEDFKVCVTESLLILRRNGFTSAQIKFSVGETLSCEIKGVDRGAEKEEGVEDEISYALLNALLGEVAFERDGNGVTAVRFEA
ncbi:MAG: hypothetical protein IJY62_04285 [Clostridia bacterium]|nr:hypothetical protein [Clostridia bacterium]